MITDLLSNILLLIATGFNFLLSPINNAIGQYLPDVSVAVNYVSNFFVYLSNVGSWVLTFFGFSSTTINLILDGLLAPILISIMAIPIKLGIKWFSNLKIG